MLINIQIEAVGWRRQRGLSARLRRAVAVAASLLPTRLKSVVEGAEFTILLTTDAKQKRLNHDFRGQNKATNVLSFPAYERAVLVKMRQPTKKLYIGDIALAYQYTVKEAHLECKVLQHHVIHLAVHGFYHLLGYDHHSDAEASAMERLERKAMASLGLPDPYAPLATRQP